MTWEIALIFVLLVAALASFAWEKIPPDLTALALFGVLVATGLLGADDAVSVFSNPAPVTVGAMFVLSAALEKCGAIGSIATQLERLPKTGLRPALLLTIVCVAPISAFINNTPVVVVFLPVVLSLAKRMDLAASKLLIPLSFASILGGNCTLIGSSTNLLVSSMAETPFHFFELAWVGVPVLLAATVYLVFIGPRLLPVRETLSSILTEDERREYLTEAYLQKRSKLVGKIIKDTPLHKTAGVRVLEVVRNGVAVRGRIPDIDLRAGDRLVLACRPHGVAEARSVAGLDLSAELGDEFGGAIETISASEGLIVEGVLGPESNLLGARIGDINFRQRFRMVILAVHRRGRNLRAKLDQVRLEFGDTLLLLGSNEAIKALQNSNDILIIDRPKVQAKSRRKKLPLVLATIAGVVAASASGAAPIEVAALVGCVFLFLTGCVTPREGYAAIQWPILFLIFGMLGMGLAMDSTGASRYIAETLIGLVSRFVAEPWQPLFLLAGIYLVTTTLTEILSNNAAAVLMAAIAIGISHSLGVDSRPFLIAVTIAASASFATPIGYQTNTYVYGVGGYRFGDFLRIGVPLNALAFVVTMLLVPLIWPLQ